MTRQAVATQPATHALAAATADTPGRPNLYVPIHKALRAWMGETLTRVGRLDVHDAGEFAATLADLEALLAQCASHVAHENAFIHPAIEARAPQGAARTGADHVEHLATIDALRAEAAALAAAPASGRDALALRLYRHLALFVAENFEHMQIEETVNMRALWDHYSDAELGAIHGRLLASIAPAELLQSLRWMVPSGNPMERLGLLGNVKRSAPPEAFLGVLAHVRPHLDSAAWDKLYPALGVARHLGVSGAGAGVTMTGGSAP